MQDALQEEVAPMAFAEGVFGLLVLAIGSPMCVGAGCLTAWLKPWRRQPTSPDTARRIAHDSGRRVGASNTMKRILAVVSYLLGFLLGCLSVMLLGYLGLHIYDGMDWGLTTVWSLVPIFSILFFIAAWRLSRGDE